MVGCDRLEVEIARDVVHHAEKPWEAVRQRAVEIENREAIVSFFLSHLIQPMRVVGGRFAEHKLTQDGVVLLYCCDGILTQDD